MVVVWVLGADTRRDAMQAPALVQVSSNSTLSSAAAAYTDIED